MKQVTAKLVYQTRTQRFYELSDSITKGRRHGEDVDIIEDLKYDRDHVKEEYKKYIPHTGITILCVSDAMTHIERLVFPAFKYLENGVEKYGWTSLQIDGKHTFMTSGGDPNAVYDDEVYIRHLGRINGMYISLIKES